MINTIKAIMEKEGYTQLKLAQAAGISQSTLSAILNGTEPKEQTLQKIADALHVSLEELASEKASAVDTCPQCGSHAVMEFFNHADGSVRFCCGFCGADTGDQRNREKAVDMFTGFHKNGAKNGKKDGTTLIESAKVLNIDELLDVSCADAEHVRPIWFENRGLFIVPCLLQCGIAERELDIVRVEWHGSFGQKTFYLSQYGSWWRCWTQKPTEAQSDAVAWLRE